MGIGSRRGGVLLGEAGPCKARPFKARLSFLNHRIKARMVKAGHGMSPAGLFKARFSFFESQVN